jgi:hypothetical protein
LGPNKRLKRVREAEKASKKTISASQKASTRDLETKLLLKRRKTFQIQ